MVSQKWWMLHSFCCSGFLSSFQTIEFLPFVKSITSRKTASKNQWLESEQFWQYSEWVLHCSISVPRNPILKKYFNSIYLDLKIRIKAMPWKRSQGIRIHYIHTTYFCKIHFNLDQFDSLIFGMALNKYNYIKCLKVD